MRSKNPYFNGSGWTSRLNIYIQIIQIFFNFFTKMTNMKNMPPALLDFFPERVYKKLLRKMSEHTLAVLYSSMGGPGCWKKPLTKYAASSKFAEFWVFEAKSWPNTFWVISTIG